MVAVKQVFFVLIVTFKCVHMHLLLDVSLIWYTECGGYVEVRNLGYGETGSIKIPDSPDTDYGKNLNCKWHLRAPINQRVLINFTSFDLENCCYCDYVEIRDGSESYSNVLKLACGRDLPEPVYSSGRYLYITFRSDYSIGGKGFVAKYRALNSSSG